MAFYLLREIEEAGIGGGEDACEAVGVLRDHLVFEKIGYLRVLARQGKLDLAAFLRVHCEEALVRENDVVYLQGCWTFPIGHGGRLALRNGKKLEKWEREFFKRNPELVNPPVELSDAEREILSKWT